MKACPTAAILIDAPRDEKKKRQLKSFTVDNGLCCFCGLCEEACNFCAIKLAPKYEFSTANKDDILWDVRKLQEMGRDVDYVDTRKKKPVKKATPSKTDTAASTPSAPAAQQATTSSAAANPGEIETGGKPIRNDESSDEEGKN